MLKKNYKNISTFIMLFTLILFSLEDCKDNSVASSYSLDDLRTIIPLKVGNSWTYRQINYFDVSPFLETLFVTKKIISEFDSAGEHYFNSIETAGMGSQSTILDVVNKNEYKSYMILKRNELILQDRSGILLHTPIKENNRWLFKTKHNHRKSELMPDSLIIVNADTSVIVLNKKYNHVIYELYNKEHYSKSRLPLYSIFISPSIGIIYQNFVGGFGGYVRELMSTNFE